MSREDTFSAEFAGNGQQLGMRMSNSIENYADSSWAEENLGWNDEKLGKVFDGDLIPTEDQLSSVLLHLKMQKATPGSDLQILRNWYEGWLEANPPETTVVQTVEELAGGEVVEEVLPEAVTEPKASTTVATLVTAEVAEQSIEKSAAIVTNVTWAPDGTSVTIGGRTIDLTAANKPLRFQVWKRLDVQKKDLSWSALAEKSGEASMSTFSNLKNGNTGVSKERAERWAKALGVDVHILFGIKLDDVTAAVTIPVEAPQVEAPTVVEVPDTTEAEAATTVAALETMEVLAHVEESTTADAQATTETAAVVVASEVMEASVTTEAPAIVEVETPIETSAPVEVSEPPTVMAEIEGEVSEQEKSRQYLLGIRHGMDNLSGEVMDLLGDAALNLQSPDFRALVVAEIIYTELRDPVASLLLKVLEAESGRFANLTFDEFFTALRSKQ